jgi:hypothetical protein
MILIIMCDLKSFADVASLSEAVASLGPSIHFLNSFWLLSTDKSVGHVHNTLHTRVGLRPVVSITGLTHKPPTISSTKPSTDSQLTAHAKLSATPVARELAAAQASELSRLFKLQFARAP